MGEGLQIERYTINGSGYVKDWHGAFCKFEDAKKFHDQLQEQLGKNMILETTNTELLTALKGAKRLAEDVRDNRVSPGTLEYVISYYADIIAKAKTE